MAVFPNGIKQFPTHRNVLDDVDASDINAIQDEIVAIERILGAGVNRDTERKFDSVDSRLSWLEKGLSAPAFELTYSDRSPRSGVGNNWAVPTRVAFPAPSSTADPMGMYNGYGVTIPVSGFWRLEGFVDWQSVGSHSGPHSGTAGSLALFVAGIAVNDSDWVKGSEARQEWTHYSSGDHHFLTPVRSGWLEKGAQVTLRTHHSSSHQHLLAAVSLSGICLRQG